MIGFILHHTGTVEHPPVWGEEVMARLFCKYLGRAGMETEIIRKDQTFARPPDATFHFSANMPVFPSACRILYLQNDWDFRAFTEDPHRWDAQYDLILHTSPKPLKPKLRNSKNMTGKARSRFFRMPADPELYFPADSTGKFGACDVVYVSNNIKPYLNQDWIMPLGRHFGDRFRIYGSMWEKSGLDSWGAPPGMVVPDLFASAKIVLALHLEDHRRYNATTCRIPEALLAGKPVIADLVGQEEFGDYVWYCASGPELVAAAEWILANYEEACARALRGREYVLKHHTFEQRTRQLLSYL